MKRLIVVERGVPVRYTLPRARLTEVGLPMQQRWHRLGVKAEVAKFDPERMTARQVSVLRDIESIEDRSGRDLEMATFLATLRPFEIARFGKREIAQGLLTNIGGNFLAKLLRLDVTPSGAGGSAAAPSMSSAGTLATLRGFDNTNTKLGIGSTTTAAAQTNLDLDAAGTRTRLSMVSGFPKIKGETYTDASGATVTVGDRQFVVSGIAAAGDHNVAWNEFTVSNGGAATGIIEATPGQTYTILDRFISAQGSKASGQIWQAWCTLTLS